MDFSDFTTNLLYQKINSAAFTYLLFFQASDVAVQGPHAKLDMDVVLELSPFLLFGVTLNALISLSLISAPACSHHSFFFIFP